jgi:hypothetical protein
MGSAKPFIAGALLGLVCVVLVHAIPRQTERQVIALFLAFTACVYFGALLAQRVPARVVVLELAVAAVVFGLAVVGLRASTGSLAAGYAIHGAWDLAHRPGGVPTYVAPWFPPACAAFDFVVALALVVGPWRLPA